MFYIYIDESGELGNKGGSSNFFIITALSTESPKALRKRVRKFKAKLYKMGWPKEIEIKGTSLWGAEHHPKIPDLFGNRRNEFLSEIISDICASPVSIHYLVAKKSYLKPHLFKAEYGIAYNFFCGRLICRAYKDNFKGPLDITIDQRSKGTHSKTKFDGYLETELIGKCEHDDYLEINHLESHNVEGLQAVDFLSWGLFRHYEHGDPTFRPLMTDRIGHRDNWGSWKK